MAKLSLSSHKQQTQPNFHPNPKFQLPIVPVVLGRTQVYFSYNSIRTDEREGHPNKNTKAPNQDIAHQSTHTRTHKAHSDCKQPQTPSYKTTNGRKDSQFTYERRSKTICNRRRTPTKLIATTTKIIFAKFSQITPNLQKRNWKNWQLHWIWIG
jgi:hypothetical protein